MERGGRDREDKRVKGGNGQVLCGYGKRRRIEKGRDENI